MRLVMDAKRHKQVFRLNIAEFKKGDWLKEIPISDLLEVTYKNDHLTINNAILLKTKNFEKKDGEDSNAK